MIEQISNGAKAAVLAAEYHGRLEIEHRAARERIDELEREKATLEGRVDELAAQVAQLSSERTSFLLQAVAGAHAIKTAAALLTETARTIPLQDLLRIEAIRLDIESEAKTLADVKKVEPAADTEKTE